MKYLVDANVLREPPKPAPDQRVIEWLREHEREIAVDPVILGELRFGILILPKSKRRTALEQWFEDGAVLESVSPGLAAARPEGDAAADPVAGVADWKCE